MDDFQTALLAATFTLGPVGERDPEQDDMEAVDGIVEAYGEDALLHGWHYVAIRLRQQLRLHAEHLGCDCGSLEWLERERLHNAEG